MSAGSNSIKNPQPTIIRLFGVEHDKYSVEKTKKELTEFISDDTDAIFFEAPPDQDLREGEGIPEPGYFVTSFFCQPFLRNPSFVVYLLLIGLFPNLVKDLYQNQKISSAKPWEWKVGQRKVSEWDASMQIADEFDIPLIKVGKPLPEVISAQEFYWFPISWAFLIFSSYAILYLLHLAAVGSTIVLTIILLIFLMLTAAAAFKGLIVQWRRVGAFGAIYLVLIVMSSYFVVQGPAFASYIIGVIGGVLGLYLPASMVLRAFIFLPFMKSTINERNTYMMKRIIDQSESNGYSDVCVVTGAGHLDNLVKLCDIRGVEYPEPFDMRS